MVYLCATLAELFKVSKVRHGVEHGASQTIARRKI